MVQMAANGPVWMPQALKQWDVRLFLSCRFYFFRPIICCSMFDVWRRGIFELSSFYSSYVAAPMIQFYTYRSKQINLWQKSAVFYKEMESFSDKIFYLTKKVFPIMQFGDRPGPASITACTAKGRCGIVFIWYCYYPSIISHNTIH